MDTLSYKTPNVNALTARKEWVVVDASGQSIGRLAAKVAKILRGKYKPTYSPHVDCGDNVIILNASQLVMTGNKMTDKQYLRYSGYPGGQRATTPAEIVSRPGGYERLLRRVIKGMMPKNRLARHIMKNLYVYDGSEHKHEAQKPKALDINLIK